MPLLNKKDTPAMKQLKRRLLDLENGNAVNRGTIKVLQNKNKKLQEKLDACIDSWKNLKNILFRVDS